MEESNRVILYCTGLKVSVAGRLCRGKKGSLGWTTVAYIYIYIFFNVFVTQFETRGLGVFFVQYRAVLYSIISIRSSMFPGFR